MKRPVERLTFCFTIRNAEQLEVYMADKQQPGQRHRRVESATTRCG